MGKIILLGFLILAALTSCSVTRPISYNIIEHSVLLNAHDYKYGYVIRHKYYKSNTLYKVGDTLPTILPNTLDRSY